MNRPMNNQWHIPYVKYYCNLLQIVPKYFPLAAHNAQQYEEMQRNNGRSSKVLVLLHGAPKPLAGNHKKFRA